MSAFGRAWVPALLAILGAAAFAAEPVPTVALSAPGRFEVAAIDATVTHAAAAAADEAWRMLAAPLALPEAFSSPVFVRIVADGDATAPPFNVAVEPGGIVSLRLRWAGTPVPVVRRALVQALLTRLAVAQHGATARLMVPLWLEHACVGVWQARADAAQLDALKQESARLPAPPTLAGLLAWQRGSEEPRAWIAGSAWLLTILQSESGRDREWLGALRRILGGEPADAALAATFGENFSNPDERELWWQTAWHQAVRARTLPTLEPADSRAQLAALARFVFAGAEDDDAVVPLGDVLARTGEPIVAVELKRRASDLERLVPALHPFYRNAGLSLAAVFNGRTAKPPRRGELLATFEADWRDANELEAASTAALDALEAKVGPAVPSRPGL